MPCGCSVTGCVTACGSGPCPTSEATRLLAVSERIPLVTLGEAPHLDLTIDGADEIDPRLGLIKGAGGALLYEKIVAAATARLVIIADSSKLVSALGGVPVPVEVVPFAEAVVALAISSRRVLPVLRRRPDGSPYVTGAGHHILDCRFDPLVDSALRGVPPGCPARGHRAWPVHRHGGAGVRGRTLRDYGPAAPAVGRGGVAMNACKHLREVQDSPPRTPRGCEECLAMGDRWVHLRLCRTCGHVGCCDSSKNKHATVHFRHTAHPMVRSFEPGEAWTWCYVDKVFMDAVDEASI